MILYQECLLALSPEIVLVATALLVLMVDLTVARAQTLSRRAGLAGMMALLGCCLAMFQPGNVEGANVPMLAITPLTDWIKVVLLLLTLFAVMLSLKVRFTPHVGEYFALLLMGATGLMLLVSADDLLMIFISLELLSLCFYALAAFNKGSLASSEAALKYLLYGGMSAAFTLFGISLIYGVASDIQLGAIATAMITRPIEPIFYAGMVMTLVGFAFKLAAAPFQFWAPDVYEGAPTPVAAFIASGSKVGSFFVLARILMTAFPESRGEISMGGALPGWAPVLAILAALSIVVGNLAAIVQGNVKRLLAYSAMAHTGYALLALLAGPRHAVPALLYYTITYAFTVLGAFAVVGVVESGGGRAALADFAGLSRRAPLLSFCMLVFMLSLAGIPPLAGFFGKFYVFTAILDRTPKLSMFWLVVVGLAGSAVSLYYYLQVLKQIYAGEPAPDAVCARADASAQLGIVLLAAIVIVLGCAPDLILARITPLLELYPF